MVAQTAMLQGKAVQTPDDVIDQAIEANFWRPGIPPLSPHLVLSRGATEKQKGCISIPFVHGGRGGVIGPAARQPGSVTRLLQGGFGSRFGDRHGLHAGDSHLDPAIRGTRQSMRAALALTAWHHTGCR